MTGQAVAAEGNAPVAASENPSAIGGKNKEKKPGTLSVLMHYAGGHKWLTIIGCVLSALAMVANMVPYVCIWLVARDLIAVAPDWGQATQIGVYGWAAFGFAAGGIVLYFMGLMCTHLAAFRTASNIRKQGMAHLTKTPLGYFDSHATGLLRRRVDGAAAETETLLAHNLADISGTIVMFVATVVLLFVFDWRMGLSVLVAAVVSIGSMMVMMTGKNAGIMQEYQDALDNLSKAGTEYVRGIPVVKVFQQTVYSFKAFKQAIDHYSERASYYEGHVCRVPQSVNLTFTEAAFVLLVPVALILAPGALESGDFAGFVANFAFYAVFSAVISTALARVMFAVSGMMLASDALSRVQEVMSAPVLPVSDNPQVPAGNSVEFRDVVFSYEGAAQPALDGVSFAVPAGATVALVGPSGGGKTTAASLIPRFWDVDAGSVLVGGVDVRDIDPHVLMDNVAFVFQNDRLFKASILDNVRAARPQATREQALEALAAAQCDDIVAKLPNGVDTVIGTQGTYLSGGEQQRIALARAILKDAPIVVLDEATAFADPENEALIQKAFAKLTQGRTVIMIAHRLSTVVRADRIVVLDRGRIAEQGTHDELVAAGNLYARMWADYQQAAQWRIDAAGFQDEVAQSSAEMQVEGKSARVSLVPEMVSQSEATTTSVGEPSSAEANRVPEEAAATAISLFGRTAKSIKRKYALTDQGVANAKKGTAWTVVVNLVMMFGIGFLYFLMMQFMATLVESAELPGSLMYVIGIVLFLVLSFAVHLMQYHYTYSVVYGEVAAVRLSLAERLRKLPLGFFGKRDLADLTETLMSDVKRLEHVWSHVLGYLYGSYISTAIIAVMLIIADWRLAIACLWGVPVAFALLFGTRGQTGVKAQEAKAAALKVSDGVQETLDNVREIRATNQEQRFLDRLNASIDASERAQIRGELFVGIFVNGASVIMRLGVATTILVGAQLMLSGSLSFMMLFMFLLVITRIYAPFDQSLALIAEVFMSEVSVERLNGIFDEPAQEGAETFEPAGYDIDFKDVAFAYEGERVLDGVSFTAREGEVTALVGPSGSGKSTCARLAARLWDAQGGTIEVGGVDVKSVDPETLMGAYSMVFQDVVLFDDTVMENIRLGRRGATDDEVRAAAAAANCDEFVERLPQGYDTPIGENGARLSGGERQRISIARALLKDAPIVLLDEATASLDVENETKVQGALSRLLVGKTVLVIAHRMRTVESADKIVVLADGRVAEQGSPADLRAREDGVYRHMAELQSASAAWAL